MTSQLAVHPNTLAKSHWEARLDLAFAHENQRSYLAFKKHLGPLVLQKTLHPEGAGCCHGIVIHPPGGVAGGDQLTMTFTLDSGANALLTTPGAGKWYKANGQFAMQDINIDIQAGACLEWMPQENILFNESQVKFNTQVHLASDATYAAWDVTCFGRQAQAEAWEQGAMQQNISIWRDGQHIWQESAMLKPQDKVMQSLVGLHGNLVVGNFVVATPETMPDGVLAQCRQVKADFLLDRQAQCGVTALPSIFAARYVGKCSQSAKQYFEALWAILRPWYAKRDMLRPRIWNT